MPMKAKRPCKHPGCPNLCDSGYCEKHRPKRYDPMYEKRRGSAASRGYDRKWRDASKAYLRQHPLCVQCKKDGFVVPAILVDHIIPHCGDQKLFWDRANWQSLCWQCHSRKTAKEDGGYGNLRKET